LNVLRTADEVRAWRASAGRLGLVPTLGALHAGHLSHVLRSARENEATIASIFVNPTQFGPHEDYAAYPRREAEDAAMLDAAGCDAVFVPSVGEMYPPGDATRVLPGPVAEPLEGAARPGHFVGVATVVTKLFAIVHPDVAYFGQKDFQQLRVLQAVARDLRLGVRVVGGPTVREPDGLAMSSRNAYLSPAQRRDAIALSRGLFAAGELWARGERDPERLRARVREETSVPGVALEYVSVADPITLAELQGRSDRAVVSLAARVGKARLIDNVLLGMDVSELS
jgi:pantoate--beta-alanine ligase